MGSSPDLLSIELVCWPLLLPLWVVFAAIGEGSVLEVALKDLIPLELEGEAIEPGALELVPGLVDEVSFLLLLSVVETLENLSEELDVMMSDEVELELADPILLVPDQDVLEPVTVADDIEIDVLCAVVKLLLRVSDAELEEGVVGRTTESFPLKPPVLVMLTMDPILPDEVDMAVARPELSVWVEDS